MDFAGEDWEYNAYNNNDTCESPIETEWFLRYSLAPSLLIIVVLSFLETRRRRCCFDEKLPRCSGCIGVLTPMDAIHTFSNRWALGFAFGVVADKLIFLFEKNYIPESLPSWANVFWVILVAIEVGISAYPFFVCLSTKYAMTGATLGFLYTAAWLAIMIVDSLHCQEKDELGEYNKIILLWPSLVCYLFLLGQFVRNFVKAVKARYGLDSIDEETSLLEGSQAQYVQRLLRKPPLEQPQKKSWIQQKVYEWDPYFQFPSRMISTAMLAIICLYMFVVIEQHVYRLVLHDLRNAQAILEELTASSNLSSNASEAVAGIQIFTEYINITEGVWMFTTFSASLMCVSYVFHILACY
ncbi:hypothetical protein JRQ81_013037, partial [Phrynocephalus forsythii]